MQNTAFIAGSVSAMLGISLIITTWWSGIPEDPDIIQILNSPSVIGRYQANLEEHPRANPLTQLIKEAQKSRRYLTRLTEDPNDPPEPPIPPKEELRIKYRLLATAHLVKNPIQSMALIRELNNSGGRIHFWVKPGAQIGTDTVLGIQDGSIIIKDHQGQYTLHKTNTPKRRLIDNNTLLSH
ncbi:hypothetical protein ACFL6U_29655 [Planctomycetota bacterium]